MTETKEQGLSPDCRRFVRRGAALGGIAGAGAMELHYHWGHLHDTLLRVIGDVGVGMAGTGFAMAVSLAIFDRLLADGPAPGVVAEMNHQYTNTH